jgi:ketosteroid isomerase-like protein
MRHAAALLCLVFGVLAAGTRPVSTASQPEDRAVVEQTIRNAIGWALTKDRPMLERTIAHDPQLFIFHPDSRSTVVGWDAFVKNFDVWMDPRFKATSFDVRDLRVTFSRGGDVAWYSCMLDDLAEWDGKPVGWWDTRWTGVLEKRDGRWVVVQMHFSFASDRAPGVPQSAGTPSASGAGTARGV